MGEHVIKLPDVGEGVAEAELVEWRVKVGDLVREDTILAAVMTDKATVEIPSPVHGEVLWLGAEIGDSVAVGSPLIRLKVDGEASSRARQARKSPPKPSAEPVETRSRRAAPKAPPASKGRPAIAAPPRSSAGAPRAPRAKGRSLRRRCGCARARPESTCGRCAGTGPAGRIGHGDIEAFLARGPQPSGESAGASAQRRRSRTSNSSASAQNRRENGDGQRAHSAHHLRRGGRRHRARGAPRRAQQAEAADPGPIDPAAVPDARDGQGDRRAARNSTPCSTTKLASSIATAASISASRADRAGLWCPSSNMRRRAISGIARPRSPGSARPPRRDRRRARSLPARRSRSPRSARSAAS